MKRLAVIQLLIFTSFLFGCLGGNESTFRGVSSGGMKVIEISGNIYAPSVSGSSPLSGISFAASGSGANKYKVVVAGKDNLSNIIGDVRVSGNTYMATINAPFENIHAMLLLKEARGGRVVYRNLVGRLVRADEFPEGVDIVRLRGMDINEKTTARTLFAMEKGAPSVEIFKISSGDAASGVYNMDYSGIPTPFESEIEKRAGGYENVFQASRAVMSVASVLVAGNIDEKIKKKIAGSEMTGITDLLNSFVLSLRDPAASMHIKEADLASSVAISGSEISDQTPVQAIQRIISEIGSASNGNFPAAVSDPSFSPGTGTYSSAIDVAITSLTSGATIYYTEDGSDPQRNSKIYSGPVRVDSFKVIKAVAVKSGAADSRIVSKTYVVNSKVPVFSIQYYRDEDLREKMPDPPYLGGGIYYIKVVADRKLKKPPSISIDSEGAANDIYESPCNRLSDYDYVLKRTISTDPEAFGRKHDETFISCETADGKIFSGIKSSGEGAGAAFIDLVKPVVTIDLSGERPFVSGENVDIEARIDEDAAFDASPSISLSGAENLNDRPMIRVGAREFRFSYKLCGGGGKVEIKVKGIRDRAGNGADEVPSRTSEFFVVAPSTSPSNTTFVSKLPAVPVEWIYYDNSSGKVVFEGAQLSLGGSKRLEIFFGESDPSRESAPAAYGRYAEALLAGEIISGIVSQIPGCKIFYRFAGEDGTSTAWQKDGTVASTGGLIVSKLCALAPLNLVRVDESHPTMNIAVRINGVYRQTIIHRNATYDSAPIIGTPLSAGDTIGYSVEDVDGNRSASISDGAIPSFESLDISKISVSAVNNKINIEYGHSITRIALYVNDSYRQTLVYSNPVSGTFVLSGKPFKAGDSIKYAIEDTFGNHSKAIFDGVIPLTSAIDVSKIYASAASNSIFIDGLHPSQKISLYVNDVYRQTIAHEKGRDTVVEVSGAVLAAGNSIKYSVESAEGNHSIAISDGTIPSTVGLNTSKIYVDAHLNRIVIDESHPSMKISLYVNDSFVKIFSHLNATGNEEILSPLELKAGDSLKYCVVDQNGNRSAFVSDGTVPSVSSLDISKIKASAASGKIIVDSSHPSGKIAVYVNGSYRQTISHVNNASNFVTVAGSALKTSDSLNYSIEDTSGNRSVSKFDGRIPGTENLSLSLIAADADAGVFKVDAGHPSSSIAVYVNDVYRQTIVHVAEAETRCSVQGSPLSAGNSVKYCCEDPLSDNQSEALSDGSIPAAPSALSIPAVPGKSNANHISSASLYYQSFNVTFAAIPSSGNISIRLRGEGGDVVETDGPAAPSSLVTCLEGLRLEGLSSEGQPSEFSATFTDSRSGNTSARHLQNVAPLNVDLTPPSFTASIFLSDGITKAEELVPATVSCKLIISFNENVLPSTINTVANTGINSDFLITSNERSITLTGAAVAGPEAFSNSISVGLSTVTITFNSVPTNSSNVPRNSHSAASADEAYCDVRCLAGQITDAAGNPAVSDSVPVK